MSYTIVLAEILAELNAIIPTNADFTTIGNVHDYVRIQDNDATTITFIKNSVVVPEWFLTRTGVEPVSEDGQLEGLTHNFILRGYYPVNDSNESEKTFQVLIDDILNHFRYEDTLDNKVWRMLSCAMTRFESIAIMLDGKFVHYCEITFRPFEYDTG